MRATAKVAQSADVDGVRAQLSQMIEQGRATEALDLVVELLTLLKDENLRLGLEVAKLMKRFVGRPGEGISTEQLDLFLRALAETKDGANTSAEDPAASEDALSDGGSAQGSDPEPTPPPPPKKRPRRQKLPAHLPRRETVIAVPDADKHCPVHGEKGVFDYERSEVLHFEPAKFWVEQFCREKRACECEASIVVAPPASKIADGGIAGPGLVADLVIGKYRDHLPLNRQLSRYARLGVKLASSTVGDWVAQGADLLEPLAKLEAKLVLESFLVQTDDTGLKVLDRGHPGNVKRGFLWVHVGDGRHCYVLYTPNKEYADEPNPALEYLKLREGYIQADAFPGYDTVFAAPGSRAIEVGCWMHGRRYYVTALDAGELLAAYPLKLIKGMYKVERDATEKGVSPEQRLEMRLERSGPLRNELGHWIADNHPKVRPKSPLAKAMGYSLNQWDALGRFLEDGRIPLDNGEAERRIRGPAMGRRNYLFAGSDAGAHRAAIVYSILGGCALNDIEPWSYMNDVFRRFVDGWPMSRLHELLPVNYAATLAAEAAAKS